MKPTVIQVCKKMTALEAIKRSMAYRVSKYANVHVTRIAVEYCDSTDMWNFEIHWVQIIDKSHVETGIYYGYMGCLGQLVITGDKANKNWNIKEFTEVI